MGLRNMHHKGQVCTQCISDTMFVFFCDVVCVGRGGYDNPLTQSTKSHMTGSFPGEKQPTGW